MIFVKFCMKFMGVPCLGNFQLCAVKSIIMAAMRTRVDW